MNKFKNLYQESILERERLIDTFNPVSCPGFQRQAYINMLVAQDCSTCANRYFWNRLGAVTNLTSQKLETMFYYNGALAFFFENDELIVSRFAKRGKLNSAGGLDKIQPIDFAGEPYGVERAVLGPRGSKPPQGDKVCIIIEDYSGRFLDEGVIPRAALNLNTTIRDETEVYSQMFNNIKLSVKKALAICDNEDQRRSVRDQAAALLNSDTPIMPIAKSKKGITDNIELWNFANNFTTENYCEQIEFYNKVRSRFNGIETQPVFEKKERMVNSEIDSAAGPAKYSLRDGLISRRNGLALLQYYYPNSAIQEVSVKLGVVENASD